MKYTIPHSVESCLSHADFILPNKANSSPIAVIYYKSYEIQDLYSSNIINPYANINH